MTKINFQNVHTMIGADASIEGPIVLNEGIIIYGRVTGDIESKGPVRVAQGAIVKGNIIGSDIRLGLLRIGFLNQPVDGNVIRDVVAQTMKLSTKARQGIAIDPLDLPIGR